MRITGLLPIGLAVVSTVAGQKNTPLRAGTAGDLTTPTLGYVSLGAAAELRPMLGVKAFPALGSRLPVQGDAKRFVLAPSQDYALAEMADSWAVVPVRAARIPTKIAFSRSATLAVFSPSGNSAAFYARDSGTISVVSGLPDAPRPAFETVAGEHVSALAVADSADVVIAGNPGSISVLRRDQAPWSAAQTGTASAIVFERNSTHAIVADSEWNQILSVRVSGSAAEVSVVAQAADGVAAPAAVAIDEGGRNLLVLNQRSILVVSIKDGAIRKLPCDFEPSSITPLTEAQTFAVQGRDAGGTWLLRLDDSEPRILYAPALD